MLVAPSPVPPNSTSPLPADWGQRQAPSLFNLFSAGLTVPPQIACAPGPASFADVSPAGALFPTITTITPNAAYPGLAPAVLAPAVYSPLAVQVAQVQAAMQQGLTANNAQLGPAVEAAGQAGASAKPADYTQAAQVYPMSLTAGLVEQRIPVSQRHKQKGPPRQPGYPGTSWGGVSVRVPGGGCQSSKPTGWALLFLLLGAGAFIALAE
jgi:hypothetical protein